MSSYPLILMSTNLLVSLLTHSILGTWLSISPSAMCPAFTLGDVCIHMDDHLALWHFSLWSPCFRWASPSLYLPIQCHCYALGLCHHEELAICELLSSIVPAHTQLPNIIITRSLSRRGFNSVFLEEGVARGDRTGHMLLIKRQIKSHIILSLTCNEIDELCVSLVYLVCEIMKFKSLLQWTQILFFKEKIICYERRLSLGLSTYRPEEGNIWP